jgi:hypothetical protein
MHIINKKKWKTVSELAKEWQLSLVYTNKIVNTAVKMGLAQEKYIRSTFPKGAYRNSLNQAHFIVPNIKRAEDLIEKIARLQCDKVSKDWKTRAQWEDVWAKPKTTTHDLLVKALDAGLMERKSFYVYQKSNNQRRLVAHYRELKPKKSNRVAKKEVALA